MKEVSVPTSFLEPDQIITSKRLKSVEVIVENEESMSREIAQKLSKLNVGPHELEIIRTNILAKDVAYTGLDSNHRRIIDYMCRSLHVDEIERAGGLWHTTYDFFRKLFADPKSHEEIRSILDSLAEKRFRIRNVKNGTVDNFTWLNRVTYTDTEGKSANKCTKGEITIEITRSVSDYHRIPKRMEMVAYGGYEQYYLTTSVGLPLQHQLLFHYVLSKRRDDWRETHVKSNIEIPLEIAVDEMRSLWGISQKTTPHDIERYWLRDACLRISVATQIKVLKIEPLRSVKRGKRIYAYRLYVREVGKRDFVDRFTRAMDYARGEGIPQQRELALSVFPQAPVPKAPEALPAITAVAECGMNERADKTNRAPRLTALKKALLNLGAYNDQRDQLNSFTEEELLWVEEQMAVWTWAGDTIVHEYGNDGGKVRKPIALLWRSLKNRIGLQTEYPKAFSALERKKKKEQAAKEKAPEQSQAGNDLYKMRAQRLGEWFANLDANRKNIVMEYVLQNRPPLIYAASYTAIVEKVFRRGEGSTHVPTIEHLAAQHGYQVAQCVGDEER